jgi:hypothetical protein
MLSSFKGELKQQSAEEAARDPNSQVTADDAQRVILDESKKAGAVALQFDPDATPEQKAAQARAVGCSLSISQQGETDRFTERAQHETASQGNGCSHGYRE